MSKESSIKVFAENASGTRPANAIPVWIDNISAIGGGGGGGGDFDPTYMSAQIDNKLNKSEISFRKVNGVDYVSGISGKDISAKFAGRAQNAITASYDNNGIPLTTTYYNAQEANNKVSDLFNFVQSNSSNWEGGSSPAGGEDVLFHVNANNDPNYGGSFDSFVSGAKELYFEALVYSQEGNPSDLIITRYGSEVGRAYWSQVSSDGNFNYFTASYNNPDGGKIGLQKNGNYVNIKVSANGVKTNAFEQRIFDCKTSDTVKFNVQGSNITGSITVPYQGSWTSLTSFTGSLTDFTAKGYEQYNADIGSEDYNQANYYDVSAEFDAGGSTVASGDVFPPTNNLDPYATYYLGWNANNGGLFWYKPENGGN